MDIEKKLSEVEAELAEVDAAGAELLRAQHVTVQHHRVVHSQCLAVVMLATFVLGTGCSDDDSEATLTTTTTTSTPEPVSCDFQLGDRVTAAVVANPGPCAGRTFDCADGRIHVEATSIDGNRLEGFAPTDQSGKPRPDTSDAVWQEHGGEYQGSGRTKLQFDCGG